MPDRLRCLNLLAGSLLGRYGELSSPRQASAVWLSELVSRLRVPGDLLDYGSKSEVAAVLLYAVVMCDTASPERQVWSTKTTWAATPGGDELEVRSACNSGGKVCVVPCCSACPARFVARRQEWANRWAALPGAKEFRWEQGDRTRLRALGMKE